MFPRRFALGGLLVFALGPACPDFARVYSARGIVRDVQPDYGQVVIEHEEIADLMPAMTMNFDAAPELLAAMVKGQAIEFTLAVSDRGYRVTRFSVLGKGEVGAGPAIAGLPAARTPAPDFALLDQDGRRLSLADLRGKAVVLDFVFTHCPGPCPILTGQHVDLQRELPEELRERTWFVSISLDPERDTPEALRAYAKARGADLSSWSFLTGPPEAVHALIRDYGVSRVRGPDDNIDHLVATFLIDGEGRIAERYLGLEHEPEQLLRDLRALL